MTTFEFYDPGRLTDGELELILAESMRRKR